MNKALEFDYKGKHYTLTYTRRSIMEMEQRGFNPQKVQDAPMSMLPMLFSGAFLTNHRGTPQSTIDDIYESLPEKEKLITKLSKMYVDPVLALMDEPKKEKAVEWRANFD